MQTACTYFGVTDTSQLGWAHQANTRTELERALADPLVHMVEGDVHFAEADALPCMAHAWQDIADLDVETWLTLAFEAGRGVKLDFAEPSAVEPTLNVLQRLKPTAPVILHANVFNLLPDSSVAATEGMEPDQFVRLAQDYCPNAILSLGWSLKREADADGRMEDVLIHQMADMLLKRCTQLNYSIEIRAGYTSGWERGAALLLEPTPTDKPAATLGGANVVNAAHLFRKVAA